MSSSEKNEDTLRRLLVELQLLQNTSGILESRLNLLEATMSETRVAGITLEELKKEGEGLPLLLPIGGGSFIKANLGNISRVIMGIGADTSVEMKLEKALEEIGSRLSEMEKAQLSVQEQLSQVLAQIRSHQETVNRLGAELRKDGSPVV